MALEPICEGVYSHVLILVRKAASKIIRLQKDSAASCEEEQEQGPGLHRAQDCEERDPRLNKQIKRGANKPSRPLITEGELHSVGARKIRCE